MSNSGATEAEASRLAPLIDAGRSSPARRAAAAPVDRASRRDDFFLPDFCQPRMVLAVVLISTLLSAVLALARPAAGPALTELAQISLFVQWLGLTGAAALCYARPRLARMSVGAASFFAFALLMVNTALLSVAVVWVSGPTSVVEAPLFGAADWAFLLRNEGICAIVAALLLRYFFVAHQWRHHVRAEARSRINALQARIRPHFLFNSLNTIAALTRSDPRRAEEAVEDLADLFRATLRDADSPLRLKEELELTRIYQRIEELRLGAARLRVHWKVQTLPMRALVPGLTVQPLLENAIYHGIEPLPEGGIVTVEGTLQEGDVVLSVTNPIGPSAPSRERSGNRLALDNIRERLQLAYAERGSLDVWEGSGEYRVTVKFPHHE
jgi:two-component system sensor histidine kinase AlgZ